MDDDLVQSEVEMLQCVYEHELEVECTEHGVALVAKLRPHTADEASKQFVQVELKLAIARRIPYPAHPPAVALGCSSGIADEQRVQLLAQLRSRAAALAEGGEASLLALIELTRERLNEFNVIGECPICMCNFVETDTHANASAASAEANLSAVLRTDCYHRYHVSCFARLWRDQWQQQQALAASTVPGLLSNLGTSVFKATAHAFPFSKVRVECPECREVVSWHSVKQALAPLLDPHVPCATSTDCPHESETKCQVEGESDPDPEPEQEAIPEPTPIPDSETHKSKGRHVFEVVHHMGSCFRTSKRWNTYAGGGRAARVPKGYSGVVAEFGTGDTDYLRPEGQKFWLPIKGRSAAVKICHVEWESDTLSETQKEAAAQKAAREAARKAAAAQKAAQKEAARQLARRGGKKASMKSTAAATAKSQQLHAKRMRARERQLRTQEQEPEPNVRGVLAVGDFVDSSSDDEGATHDDAFANAKERRLAKRAQNRAAQAASSTSETAPQTPPPQPTEVTNCVEVLRENQQARVQPSGGCWVSSALADRLRSGAETTSEPHNDVGGSKGDEKCGRDLLGGENDDGHILTADEVAVAVRAANAKGLLAPQPQRSLGDLGGQQNQALRHAAAVMKSERARVDASLAADFESVLQGHTIYLPAFFAGPRDFTLLRDLARDLTAAAQNTMKNGSGTGMISWSQHLKHESPTFSPTFTRVCEALERYFDVHIYATRLNFYRDGRDWKPFHHDSHAYGADGKKEDFTMGVSFGAERRLDFLHPGSGQTFGFPQRNGDVFAFTSDANKRFKHGVPRLRGSNTVAGPRFSIIAWGRRRTLNARNGGVGELESAERMRLAEREAAKMVEIRGSGAVVRAAPSKPVATEILPSSRVDSNAPDAGAWKQAHTTISAQSTSHVTDVTAVGGEQECKKNERVMEGSDVLRSVEKHIENELSRPMRTTCKYTTGPANARVHASGKHTNATGSKRGKTTGKKKSSRASIGAFERVQHNRKDPATSAAAAAAATVAAADHSLYLADDAGLDDLDNLDDLEDE